MDEIKAQFQAQIETMLEPGGHNRIPSKNGVGKPSAGKETNGIRDIQRGMKANLPSDFSISATNGKQTKVEVDIELQSSLSPLSFEFKST